jgi:hypothetical protein
MKKRWLIGCSIVGILGVGMFAGLIALAVGGVFALTRPVVDASEQFLALLGEGRISEAYSATADGFRARQDEASFAAAVKQLGLGDFASAFWNSRQIENQTGTAEGIITTKSGGTRPVSIRLVRERGRWAVDGVRYGGVELAFVKAPPTVPSGADLERMVSDALLGFNKAVRGRDFTAFYATLSDLWKKQTTPAGVQQIFQEFIEKDIDIGGIQSVKPQIAPAPAINDKGVLVVAGHYPTRPSQVRFELEYIHEPAGWKLVSVLVGVREVASGE